MMTLEKLEELSVYELYPILTGNVAADIHPSINAIKAASEPEKTELIGKLLYTLPGGVYAFETTPLFKTKLYEEVNGVVTDTDNDGDVDQDDYEAVKEQELDVNNDGKFDEEDLELVKAMSTVEIIEDTEFDDEPEETEPEETEPVEEAAE